MDALDRRSEELLHSLAKPAELLDTFGRRLLEEGLLFGKGPLPTFLRPHLIEAQRFDHMVATTEKLFRLIEKLAARVISTPALLDWLGFSAEAVKLMKIDPGYSRAVVVARPDAVTRGDDPRFIEINCDSPAMMTFADVLENVLFELVPHHGMNITRVSRVRALLDALLSCWRNFGGQPTQPPTIAIVDWPGEKTAGELKKTAEQFSLLGVETLVVAPTELHLSDGRLHAQGKRIDLVYRRVLFRDFLTRKEELEPLLTAYRTGKVCMVNPLSSYVVGTKALLALLHDPANAGDLDAAERALVKRHIPDTRLLSSARELDRTRWVLKKAESYGGKDVIMNHLDAAGWDALVRSNEPGWVQQELEAIPQLALPELSGDRLTMVKKYMNWNPFVFGGRHGGSITRVSDSVMINISRGGGLLPSVRAELA